MSFRQHPHTNLSAQRTHTHPPSFLDSSYKDDFGNMQGVFSLPYVHTYLGRGGSGIQVDDRHRPTFNQLKGWISTLERSILPGLGVRYTVPRKRACVLARFSKEVSEPSAMLLFPIASVLEILGSRNHFDRCNNSETHRATWCSGWLC